MSRGTNYKPITGLFLLPRRKELIRKGLSELVVRNQREVLIYNEDQLIQRFDLTKDGDATGSST